MFDKYLWKIKFKAEIKRKLEITGQELIDCASAESENYFDDDQLWTEYSPEDAVAENLSYWTD